MEHKDGQPPKPASLEACRHQLSKNLVEIQDTVANLKTLLEPALRELPAARGEFGMLDSSVSRALSLLNCTSAAVDWHTAKRVACLRKRSCRRRQPYSWTRKVVSKSLDDGHNWRKYGQKDIQNSKHPRGYFRCTHKLDRGCMAIRQVQASEVDPSSYEITYLGEHTCQQKQYPTLCSDGSAAGCSEEKNINGRQGALVLRALPSPIPGCTEEESAEKVLPSNPKANDHGGALTSCSHDSHGKSFMEDADELEMLLDFDQLLGEYLQDFPSM